MSILNTPGAVGTWVKLPTIESVQILAHAGYDFVVIDQEHAPIDIRTAYQLVNTATAEGLLALVRVDELRPASIQRILDAGAAGVLIPHIDTPEQAELAARSVRFPPFGIRGAGGTSRAGRWGTLPTADYLASGNDQALCIPQLESKLAIDNVEKIAAVAGVDALFVGVADLSMDMGTTPVGPGSRPALSPCPKGRPPGRQALRFCLGFGGRRPRGAGPGLRFRHGQQRYRHARGRGVGGCGSGQGRAALLTGHSQDTQEGRRRDFPPSPLLGGVYAAQEPASSGPHNGARQITL